MVLLCHRCIDRSLKEQYSISYHINKYPKYSHNIMTTDILSENENLKHSPLSGLAVLPILVGKLEAEATAQVFL